MPVCFKCKKSLPSADALLIHFKSAHRKEIFDRYQCIESPCYHNFKGWPQLRRHLNKHHAAKTVLPAVVKSKPVSDNFDAHDDLFEIPDNEDFRNFKETPKKDLKQEIYDFLLLFVGKLYADPSLPRSHVQVILEETKALFNQISSVIMRLMEASLESHRSDQKMILEVKEVFEQIFGCFEVYSTEYRRLKIISETGNLLYPKAYTIGFSMEERKRENQMVKEIVPMTGQFIPLRKLLKMFFSLPGIFDKCKRYMDELEKESEVVSNFVQGKLWREKKEKHFQNRIVFPLFVYFDDLEVNNPLGSHKGLSKLGATYVSIPCLPQEFRSTLDNIFLALLFHSLDRSRYGNTAVFNILVNEINYLQRTGITIDVSGAPVKVYFALGLILGDNLGLNGILGFVECFRANYFCRFCTTHRDITQHDCEERSETLRKVEDYDDDVWSPVDESGVKEASIWNNVDFFHVYENYCSDPLLHELAEGAGKRAVRQMIHYYVHVKKIFTVDRLNQRLKTFPYNASGISNKPPIMSEKEVLEKKIHMSGSETINFLLIFGLLVGDLIPEGDEVMSFYRILRQILEIVSAKAVSKKTPSLLKHLVSEYNRLYVKLFNENLKAKEHIMVHWPLIMEMSGPLSLISTMRFESKNRIFKIRSNATSSRINIVYTTALKEQLQFCFRLVSQCTLESKFECGPASYVEEVSHEPGNLQSDFGVMPRDTYEKCVEVPWVNVKGTLYKIGMCLVIDYDEYDMPVFGDILKIYCSEEQQVYFFCSKLCTLEFQEHFWAFEVLETSCTGYITYHDLITYMPVIHYRNGNGNRYVCMR